MSPAAAFLPPSSPLTALGLNPSPLRSARRTPPRCAQQNKQPQRQQHQQQQQQQDEQPVPKRARIPRHSRPPLLGLALDLLTRDTPGLRLASRLGPLYHTDHLGRRVVAVADLRAMTALLRDRRACCADATPVDLKRLFGANAVFALDGRAHTAARAPLNPAFAPAVLAAYFPQVLSSARRLWQGVADDVVEARLGAADNCAVVRPVDAEAAIKVHFLRIIATVTNKRGVPDDPKTADTMFINLRQRFKAMMSMLFTLPLLPGPGRGRAEEARVSLRAEIAHILQDRLRDEADTIQRLRASELSPAAIAASAVREDIDLLTILAAASPLPTAGPGEQREVEDEERERDASENDDPASPPESFQDALDEVVNQVLLIWFAGYATQGTALQSMLVELAADTSGLLDRLRAEQRDIAELSIAAVRGEMPLLHSFVMECLRMFPPVPALLRKLVADTPVLGHVLPAGTTVLLDVRAAQRDYAAFERGDEFQPERFVGLQAADLPGLAVFGTMGSPHYCVGAGLAMVTLKTTLAVLIREFDFALVNRKTRKYVSMPEVKPAGGVMVTMMKKEPSH